MVKHQKRACGAMTSAYQMMRPILLAPETYLDLAPLPDMRPFAPPEPIE